MNAVLAPNTCAPGPLDLMKLALRFNLHPERDLHPSWLPADWPTPFRSLQRFGPGGQAELARLARQWTGADGASSYDFDTPRRRLGLIDAHALRWLAIHCGFCVHKPLFELDALAPQMHRQARRFGHDLPDFIRDRVPQLPHVAMSLRMPQRHPHGLGRLVVDRGYRLLLSVLAAEGESFVRRVRVKLPRRVAAMPPLSLRPQQIDQLSELIFLCILPERIPQWDWLS